MAKGYWITFYRSVSDAGALAKYASLAGPIIQAKGGRILARGNPGKFYEAGINERVVLIEFESLKHAMDAYESEEYQEVLAILKDRVERDIRFMSGVE